MVHTTTCPLRRLDSERVLDLFNKLRKKSRFAGFRCSFPLPSSTLMPESFLSCSSIWLLSLLECLKSEENEGIMEKEIEGATKKATPTLYEMIQRQWKRSNSIGIQPGSRYGIYHNEHVANPGIKRRHIEADIIEGMIEG